LRKLKATALGGRTRLVAPLLPVEDELTTAAAEDAAATAKRITERPIALTFRGEDVGTLQPRLLVRLVRFRPAGDHFDLYFDRKRLVRAVQPALAPWRQRARNARFVVSGDGVSISPSRPGLDVNATAVQEAAIDAAYGGRTLELSLKQTRADLTTAEAEALGIRERISTFTTEMGTSSANRIHNVHLMAEYIDGTIIRPGELFSFNEGVGPRTVERGFREGQMIIGSLLLPSIGGGVCQTATTLFNNAFELGFPIVKRYNHSFYISHYPMGRDATVSWGGPDFVFRNDLKTAILIKTRYTHDTLTFSFYGTDPERRVELATGPQVNWRSPRTTYALDPYAPRGSVRTVSGSNQSGFDVTVTRQVYEKGKLIRKDAVTSNYVAVGPTQIYGPGRSIPGPYFVLPRV
jgi:vancomycin resistance protein YoaR